VAVVDQILEAVNLVDQEEALLVTRQGARLHLGKEVMAEEDLVVKLALPQGEAAEKIPLEGMVVLVAELQEAAGVDKEMI
jgi:succinyl-CoA synthetase beta subunit